MLKNITQDVKEAFALMHGHISPNCLNDTFIMDKEFCFSKGDFKIMRESINDRTGVAIPFKKFENASISDIVVIIENKIKPNLS